MSDTSAPFFVPPAAVQTPSAAQQRLIDDAVAKVAGSADLYAGVTIVHNILTDSVEYMSRRGLALLQVSLPELRAMGFTYHARFFNPADSQDYLPQLYEMVMSPDPTMVTTFFQQVRTIENSNWTWYLSTSRMLLRDPSTNAPLLLITTACPIDSLHHVTHKVQRLLDENNFLRRHHEKFASLTTRERQVLACLAQGKSSPEIANQLFLSSQTVDTHRRNLRQKLQVDSTFDLTEYARAFDLV